MERGVMRNKNLTINNYNQLQYGKITATDIDGFMEFQNRIFVIMEGKKIGIQLPQGQLWAIENLTDSIQLPKKAIAIIFENTSFLGDEVNVAYCKVRDLRFQKKWYKEKTRNVKQVVDDFLKKYAPDLYNKYL